MKIFILLLSVALCGLTSNAQTKCDSLDLEISYNAFYDSLIEVKVTNNGATYFNYPGFIIYDANHDTVAKEKQSLFGISTASVHNLTIYPGMVTNPSFNGTLDLYTYNYDSLTCSYPMNFQLCPDTCKEVIVSLANMGGAIFTGTVQFAIKNSSAQTIRSGMFTIGNDQYDADTFCMYPGDYTLELSQSNLTPGGGKYYSIVQGNMSVFPFWWAYNETTDTTFPFSFYKKCPLISDVKTVAQATEGFSTRLAQGLLHVSLSNTSDNASIAIYTVDGRMITKAKIQNGKYQLNTDNIASGIYIIKVLQEGKQYTRKVLIE